MSSLGNRTIGRTVSAGLLTVAALAGAHAAVPQRACANADLAGTYAFSAKGITTTTSSLPGPLQGPFASGGFATFDGAGGFTLTAATSFNGIAQDTLTVGGTYDVDADCTYVSRADNGVTFLGAIVDDGRELLILQTTPGVVVTGNAIAQDPLAGGPVRVTLPARGCEGLPLGRYGFVAEGVAGPPTIPAELAGPLAGVGTVTFAADGTFAARARRSLNGVLDPDALPLTGRFTRTGECTFAMAFDVGFTFDGTIGAGGREIRFVETDPGTTLLVTAKRH